MVKQQRNSILIAVVLLLFMGAVTELLVAVQRTTQSHDQNAQLNSRANDARAFLERELYSAVFTAVGVSSFLEMRRGVYSEEEMENWLARLYVQSAHLKNIAIAPDNRVRTVYPPDNNRSVIGLYYPGNADCRAPAGRWLHSRPPSGTLPPWVQYDDGQRTPASGQ